jgi:ketosteroid isomerase-like protein
MAGCAGAGVDRETTHLRCVRAAQHRRLGVGGGGVDADAQHRFVAPGPGAVSGHTREGLRRWFERLFRLFPQLRFAVAHITVGGPPWDLTVAAQWTAEVTPAHGPPYENVGVHVIRIRRGRVVSIQAYEDSDAIARACQIMLEHGIAEAGAEPITA